MAQSNESTQASWRCIGLLSGHIPLFKGRVPWEQKASKREFNTVHGGRNRVYASAYWGDSHFPIQSYLQVILWFHMYLHVTRASLTQEVSIVKRLICLQNLNIRASNSVSTFSSLLFPLGVEYAMHNISYITYPELIIHVDALVQW